MKNLVIIPARCGSKGIPDKNIISICGLPLIAHTIKNIPKSEKNHVIVSTDCEKIKSVAQRYGAEVPFLRPKSLALDNSKSIDFILHAINFYINKGHYFDSVILLQPTTPLRSSSDINQAISQFKEAGSDSLISVYQEDYINDLVMNKKKERVLEPINANHNKGVRRQDHGEVFVRNGAIYITKVSYLLEYEQIISDKPAHYIMSKYSSINIDNYEDLDLARKLMC